MSKSRRITAAMLTAAQQAAANARRGQKMARQRDLVLLMRAFLEQETRDLKRAHRVLKAAA